MTEEQPPKPRSKRIYVMWGVALALLLALGTFCWAVVVPVWRAHRVLREYRFPRGSMFVAAPREAKAAIGQLGGPERAAVSLGLYLRLPSRAAKYRGTAVHLLGWCGEPAVPVLARVLVDSGEGEGTRLAVASDLGYIGRRAEIAVPTLAKSLGDASSGVRGNSANALGRFGPKALAAVPALLARLDDDNTSVRARAAWALGQVGPEARDAIPALEKLLKDKGMSVRKAAAEALEKIKAAQEKKPAR